MKPIYEPKGTAKEYGDLALNIYTGCPHRCFYCYVPNVLRCEREKFHTDIRPRPNIVEETHKQLEREHITGKLIHLCFTCDPYPTGYDTSATREIIKLIKNSGNNVQILTKCAGSLVPGWDGAPIRDFDLLDHKDWFGVTLDGSETMARYVSRSSQLITAHKKGIKTWISFEPVVRTGPIFKMIEEMSRIPVDRVAIGKQNYYKSEIDWKKFGEEAEYLCKNLGLNYYIKDSLRKEMNKCTTK